MPSAICGPIWTLAKELHELSKRFRGLQYMNIDTRVSSRARKDQSCLS